MKKIINRKWTDEETEILILMRKSGVSFPLISTILERPAHAIQVKATKLGITGIHKESNNDLKYNFDKFAQMPALSKGKISEDIATIEFQKRNIDVFLPYKPQHHTDLLLVHKKKLQKFR